MNIIVNRNVQVDNLKNHENFYLKRNLLILKNLSPQIFQLYSSITCQLPSYGKIPFYNNHIEASVITKLILAYS